MKDGFDIFGTVSAEAIDHALPAILAFFPADGIMQVPAGFSGIFDEGAGGFIAVRAGFEFPTGEQSQKPSNAFKIYALGMI